MMRRTTARPLRFLERPHQVKDCPIHDGMGIDVAGDLAICSSQPLARNSRRTRNKVLTAEWKLPPEYRRSRVEGIGPPVPKEEWCSTLGTLLCQAYLGVVALAYCIIRGAGQAARSLSHSHFCVGGRPHRGCSRPFDSAGRAAVRGPLESPGQLRSEYERKQARFPGFCPRGYGRLDATRGSRNAAHAIATAAYNTRPRCWSERAKPRQTDCNGGSQLYEDSGLGC